MRLLVSFSGIELNTIIIIAVIAILVIILLAVLINKSKYKARYKNFYRRMDKAITKKFNGNMLIEDLINRYSIDNSNTFKSLKSKGRKKTKKYLEYFYKNLPELVMLKSFISPDKNKNQLIILFLDENNKVIYHWDKSRKVKGLIKAINRHQMLNTLIAFLYELPLNINEGAPYRFVNHENECTITYDIVKNPKKTKRKMKQKQYTKKELKAQEKVIKAKEKKAKKK
jgi:hypothetical protein